MTPTEARERHECLSFLGLRAHATSSALVQLRQELVAANLLDAAAMARIKEAICGEISVSTPHVHAPAEFEASIRNRLDTIFIGAQDRGTACPLAGRNPG
ncbi:hypothetical protein E2493_14305 [Sphingomonas parva]|uniref:Uncharacterized protein n=1 Tax=Sphingomonas parva TaxID=2555898 RepID=A0A4Y8ZNH2_9SPHN|nr:hypothetical protein [Sphingomonas parva]TFI57541.1 hypothetical protein E2493_14305 [Sphingomonas parva]